MTAILPSLFMTSTLSSLFGLGFFNVLWRPETVEEKLLKEEIDILKKKLEEESTLNTNKESVEDASEEKTSLVKDLQQKERELEFLIRDLDDKVRFGQRVVERPGSGAGRPGSGAGRPGSRPGSRAGRSDNFPDRPPSQSGSFEESRSMEFTDRPPSRGTRDAWMRPNDDRRPFQGFKDKGFPSNRGTDRSRSRERW